VRSANSRVVAAGYDNGDVKILDLVAGKMRWETNVSNGVCGLEARRHPRRRPRLLCSHRTHLRRRSSIAPTLR
jgi:hypothetical protein